MKVSQKLQLYVLVMSILSFIFFSTLYYSFTNNIPVLIVIAAALFGFLIGALTLIFMNLDQNFYEVRKSFNYHLVNFFVVNIATLIFIILLPLDKKAENILAFSIMFIVWLIMLIIHFIYSRKISPASQMAKFFK